MGNRLTINDLRAGFRQEIRLVEALAALEAEEAQAKARRRRSKQRGSGATATRFKK